MLAPVRDVCPLPQRSRQRYTRHRLQQFCLPVISLEDCRLSVFCSLSKQQLKTYEFLYSTSAYHSCVERDNAMGTMSVECPTSRCSLLKLQLSQAMNEDCGVWTAVCLHHEDLGNILMSHHRMPAAGVVGKIDFRPITSIMLETKQDMKSYVIYLSILMAPSPVTSSESRSPAFTPAVYFGVRCKLTGSAE